MQRGSSSRTTSLDNSLICVYPVREQNAYQSHRQLHQSPLISTSLVETTSSTRTELSEISTFGGGGEEPVEQLGVDVGVEQVVLEAGQQALRVRRRPHEDEPLRAPANNADRVKALTTRNRDSFCWFLSQRLQNFRRSHNHSQEEMTERTESCHQHTTTC